MKLCSKCNKIMEKSSYFQQWVCTNKECHCREDFKNSLYIEKLDKYSYDFETNKKINEIIDVINKITSSDIKFQE